MLSVEFAMQPQPNSLKEKHGSAWKACREWFGRGKRELAAAEGLVEKFGLEMREAMEVYRGVFCEIRDEFEEFRRHPEVWACKLYREIRDEKDNAWSARLTAQVEMDELLDLPALAQDPGGQELRDVLEAYEFYRAVLAADGPTRHQKLRAQKRLMLLACGRSQRARNRPARSAAATSEIALRRTCRKQLADKAAREPANPEAQRLAEIANGKAPAVATPECRAASPADKVVSETPAAIVQSPPSTPITSSQAPDSLPTTTPTALSQLDAAKLAMQDQIRDAILSAPPDADPYQVGLKKYLELKYGKQHHDLLSAAASHPADASPALPTDSGTAGQSSATSPQCNAPPRDLQTPPSHAPPTGESAA